MENVENVERESKSSIRDSLKTINTSGDKSLGIMMGNWKDFYLHKLFKTGMGNGIDAVVTTNYNPKYNYVSRDSNGNGVVGFVDEIEGEEPFPAGTMSLALGGSFLGSCFIQKEHLYSEQGVGGSNPSRRTIFTPNQKNHEISLPLIKYSHLAS